MNRRGLLLVLVMGVLGCQTPQLDQRLIELVGAIRHEYKPSTEFHTLSVQQAGQPLALPATCVIDIETGNGHGGYLCFMRFEVRGRKVAVESAEYGPRCMRPSRAKINRVVVERKAVGRLLELVQVLPSVQLTEQENRPPPREISRRINPDGSVQVTMGPRSAGWWSSNDFFVLVRVRDEHGKVLYEDEFAGYPSGHKQSGYLPLQCVGNEAWDWTKKQTGWIPVSGAAMRTSHCTDAFRLDCQFLGEDFHWWVMEDSVEALGFWGNREVLPVLQEIRATHTNIPERIAGKIDQFIAKPDYWLADEPKDLKP
ncbi:MAG: hypothetical protein WCG79_04430 [Verrucomicrobiota bacterium]